MPLPLYSDESILLTLRRHRFILYRQFLVFAFLFLIPSILYSLINNYAPQWLTPPFNRVFFLGAIFYALFLWAYLFITWIDYYLDIWIVTTERIIDTELKGLFHRELSEFKLSRIQDVTVGVNGPLQTFLNYGDVHVQTAGEAKNFIFYEVPHPYKVKEVILKAHDEYMDHKLSHRHDFMEGA